MKKFLNSRFDYVPGYSVHPGGGPLETVPDLSLSVEEIVNRGLQEQFRRGVFDAPGMFDDDRDFDRVDISEVERMEPSDQEAFFRARLNDALERRNAAAQRAAAEKGEQDRRARMAAKKQLKHSLNVVSKAPQGPEGVASPTK